MEKEGMLKALNFLASKSLEVGTLVTDRHKQVSKFVRQQHPHIDHRYDIWHVSKGIKKKLGKLSKQADCDLVREWTKSITNHLYWCAANGIDGDDILKRWKSLIDHICDEHDECYHTTLSPEDRRKKWFTPGSKAYEKLYDILCSKTLLPDIKKLSSQHQTSSLEAYHSVVNHFAPKLLSFSYHGLHSRLLLAILHFNENFGRPQARTREGKERLAIAYTKAKAGECTPKPIPVPKTYIYVEKLMHKTVEYCTAGEKHEHSESPPPLASAYEHPDKDTTPSFSRYKR
ncbi:uncharacterized protein [Dysidea avara]|uniref:uncharacterized protein n=1 Tax=Dysidea avara TaxID=196820 RepID=UPI003317A84D